MKPTEYYFDDNNGELLLVRINSSEKIDVQKLTEAEYHNILAFHAEQRLMRSKYLQSFFKEKQ
jgi:hypothetical protein